MINISIAIFLSIISTCIMSFISMAAPIGPWIAPTLVACATICFIFIKKTDLKDIALVTVSGSIGGIIATGFGFSFPAIFFCDPQLYTNWLSNPFYFFSLLGSLTIAAGALGLLIADVVEHELIVVQKLPFPIGQLIYNLVSTGTHISQTVQLLSGALITIFFYALQDGFFIIRSIIPKSITIFPRYVSSVITIPALSIDLFPLLWAIGFITGHLITVPLLIGGIARVFIIDPFHQQLFFHLSSIEFILAFCSGMVLFSTLQSFFSFHRYIVSGIHSVKNNIYNLFFSSKDSSIVRSPKSVSWAFLWQQIIRHAKKLLFFSIVMGGVVTFFYQLKFSIGATCYIIISTCIWSYQIAVIAGKIGLAPLGRFATFVMVPAMMLFNLSMTQLIFVSTFVEVCCGVVADVLFGRKLAQLACIDRKQVAFYQWLGLFISSLIIGISFWILSTSLTLGSAQLFAQKAQSRTLLLTAGEFNYIVLFIGALFGMILSYINVNSMLVLGGILMPITTSLGLIAGGLIALLTKHKEKFEPFCSGIFAANSLWMIIRAFLSIIF